MIMLFAAAMFDLPMLMLLAGVVIVIIMLQISARRRMTESRNKPQGYVRENFMRMQDQEGVRNDISELIMQLEKLSREINSQIDVRFAKLEKAIADADQRISELKSLNGQKDAFPPYPEKVHPTSHDVQKGQVLAAAAPPRPTEASDSSSSASPSPIDSSTADQPSSLSLAQQVLQLTQSGHSTIDIARQLGRSVGEIELIISLNRPSGN